MFGKWRKYSYAAQKQQRNKLYLVLVWLGAFFVLYLALTNFFFSFRILENESMRPTLRAGERFIVRSYGFSRLFAKSSGDGQKSLRLDRGSIVVIDPSLNTGRSLPVLAADTLARFFTAQRIGLINRENRTFIKRLVALPGDEISMKDFVLRVKPAGQAYGLTEYEFAVRPYHILPPQVSPLWDESLPFSGTMDTLVLSGNQCFVLSDDRSNTNDSRTWGPVPMNVIAGQVVFRYWPFTRFERF
ncbi:MAG: signal peptidase I [Spirochaetaceae bacterium]|jgi:signal peptidase I|nr:signal peptidase I [Spirochaetaceae bacterium]